MRSSAERLAELRGRLAGLESGQPSTADEVRRARERANAQAEAVATARQRLVQLHRSAAARHEMLAELFAREGRTRRAERERDVARRQDDAALRTNTCPGQHGEALTR